VYFKELEDMTLTEQRTIRFTIGAMFAFMLAGCVSSEQFYEDVRLSRKTAYRHYKMRKDRERESQPLISGKLSLADSLKLTLANNKNLQRVMQERQVARGQRLGSYSAILPSVTATAGWQEIDEVGSITIPAFLPGGQPQEISMGDIHTYSADLTVSQPIFAGGSIPATLNAARLFSLLTDETVRAAVQDVIYGAESAYYELLLSQHLAEVAADAVRSAKAGLNSVKQKRRGGVASDFDVLRAQVELSNFEAELIKNRNDIDIANANLIKIMGVSQDSDFLLADQLEYVPSQITMEQAVGAAYRNRPDLLGREFDIKYQTELLKIVRSRYWPMVSGYYTNLWSKPDPDNRMEIEWGHSWQAGFTATLPIFDGFAREGEIIQQKARVKQAQIDLIDAEETALFELTKAQLSIENAKKFVESQQLNMARAKEGLRLAEVSYREGTKTQVELIDAQVALTRARVNYYQAIHSHTMAKLALQKAMGTLATVEAVAGEADAGDRESVARTGSSERGQNEDR
jgi:outer membrane protein TolC